MKSVIDIQNVTKSFGKKVAVKNLTLSIKGGEVFGFLGPNGAGKTTTMKMILGLLRPDTGSIHLFGENAGSIHVKKKIGFLPEFAYFYQHLTGQEFLHFVGEIFHLPESVITKRSRQLLSLVNLPVDAHNRQIGTYSKGMQQRIGMAQALMNDPEILFLDEPMSGLDPIGRREIKDLILSLKKEGKTIFFNSHILADAEAICDRIGIIHCGQLLLDDEVKKIVPRGKTLEDIFIETISKKMPMAKVKKDTKAKKMVSAMKKTPEKSKKPIAKASVKKAERKTAEKTFVKPKASIKRIAKKRSTSQKSS